MYSIYTYRERESICVQKKLQVIKIKKLKELD